MTSAINTNGINVNYPVPGVNNNSQGFRDNFAAIKNNLNTASAELTDLQNKVVVKQALDGTVVNNDMANTLISNALTRSFRASVYNLGNALSGTVIIDVSLGDVQYGTIAGNTTIQFGGWSPSGTQSNVELILSFSNTDAYISFPSQVINTNNFGAVTVENYSNVGNVASLSVPYGVTQLDFKLSTLDCGNTIYIEPVNRPRQSTQIQQRTPPPTGQQGDTIGTISVDIPISAEPTYCTSSNSTYDYLVCGNTAGFFPDMPIVFSGNIFEGNLTAGNTYFVRTIGNSTTFTVSSNAGTVSGPGTLVQLSGNTGNMTVSPVTYMYTATQNYDGSTLERTSANTFAVTESQVVTGTRGTGNLITITSTSNLAVNDPITFSGTSTSITATATDNASDTIQVTSTSVLVTGMPVTFTGTILGGGNLSAGNTFFVKTIANSTHFSVTNTYSAGTLGSNINLTTTAGSMNVVYGGVFEKYSSGTNTGNLSSSNTYYVKTLPSGTTLTVSNIPGGAPVAMFDADGPTSGAQAMNATFTTNYVVSLNNTTSISANDPIIFTGNVFGGVTANIPYYVSSISGSNITISQTRYNGIAGQTFAVSTANGNMDATVMQGTNIFKRVSLIGW